MQMHAAALRVSCAAAVALALCWPASAAAAAGCEKWESSQFFREATPAAVQECLSLEADPNAGVADGCSDDFAPLHLAAQSSRDPAVIAALLDAGADPNVKVRATEVAPLHIAAVHNSRAAVEALIQAGAELHARDAVEGSTPLHVAAAYNSSPDVTAALLDAGADQSNQGHKNGFTPLHMALSCNNTNNLPIVRILLEHGADVRATDIKGLTVMHMAAHFSREPAIIAAMAKAGADPNARQDRADYPVRWRPLHFAAGYSTPAMIAALIEAGAGWQIKTSDGYEPLFLAVALNDIPDAASALEATGARLGTLGRVGAKVMGLITKAEQLAFPPDETGVAFGGPLPADPNSLPSR